MLLFEIRKRQAGDAELLSLRKTAEWNHNHFVTNLVWDGQHLIVGDAISSVSVLNVTQEPAKLESVARDYGPLWPVAVESTGNGVIGANVRIRCFTPLLLF